MAKMTDRKRDSDDEPEKRKYAGLGKSGRTAKYTGRRMRKRTTRKR